MSKRRPFKVEKSRNGKVPRAMQRDVGGVYDGTVGHDDGSPHFDLEEGGMALLKVTLFHGHNPVTEGENTTPTRARGRQILVRIDPETDGIPADGAHVVVACIAGRAELPGGHVLLKVTRPSPKWAPNAKSNDRIWHGPKDTFIRIKEDGSFYAVVKSGDNPDTAKPVQIELSKDGFRVNHPYGEAYCDSDGWGMSSSSGAKISGGAIGGLPPPLDALGSFVNIEGALVRIKTAGLQIGTATIDNLMRSTPTLGTLSAMQAAITAQQATMTALLTDLLAVLPFSTGPTPPPTATPANALAITAVAAAGTALAACTTYGPTQSCMSG